jgi:hypothetical protein
MNVQVREFAAASSVQHVLHRDYAESALIALYSLQYSRLHGGTPPPGAQPGSIDSNITQQELQNA